jgi:uncharacterized membrane protein YgdD (TMEM256/DUF423 family)
VSTWLAIAALNGALAVAAGAFASHGLSGDAHAFGLFDLGARYHMYHALALGLSALAMRNAAAPRARLSAWFFLSGIVLFSGSLYMLALTGEHLFVYVVPFGGIAFMGGWLVLVWAGLKLKH